MGPGKERNINGFVDGAMIVAMRNGDYRGGRPVPLHLSISWGASISLAYCHNGCPAKKLVNVPEIAPVLGTAIFLGRMAFFSGAIKEGFSYSLSYYLFTFWWRGCQIKIYHDGIKIFLNCGGSTFLRYVTLRFFNRREFSSSLKMGDLPHLLQDELKF